MSSISHRSETGRGALRRILPGLAAMPVRAVCLAARWLELRRQARRLSELDAHLLRDIGLTEADRRAAIITPRRKQAAAMKEH